MPGVVDEDAAAQAYGTKVYGALDKVYKYEVRMHERLDYGFLRKLAKAYNGTGAFSIHVKLGALGYQATRKTIKKEVASGLYHESEAVEEAGAMMYHEYITLVDALFVGVAGILTEMGEIAHTKAPVGGGVWVTPSTIDVGLEARYRGTLHVLQWAARRVCRAIMQHPIRNAQAVFDKFWVRWGDLCAAGRHFPDSAIEHIREHHQGVFELTDGEAAKVPGRKGEDKKGGENTPGRANGGPPGGGKPGVGGNPNSKIACRDHANKGQCPRGSKCQFNHSMKPPLSPAAAPAWAPAPGAWPPPYGPYPPYPQGPPPGK